MHSDTHEPTQKRKRNPWLWLSLAAVLWACTVLWALQYVSDFQLLPTSTSNDDARLEPTQDVTVGNSDDGALATRLIPGQAPQQTAEDAQDGSGSDAAGNLDETAARAEQSANNATQEASRDAVELKAQERIVAEGQARATEDDVTQIAALAKAENARLAAEAQAREAEAAAQAEAQVREAEAAAQAEAQAREAEAVAQAEAQAREAEAAAQAEAQAREAEAAAQAEAQAREAEAAAQAEAQAREAEAAAQAEAQAREAEAAAEALAAIVAEERAEDARLAALALREQQEIDAVARALAAEEAARAAEVAQRRREFELLRAQELGTLSVLSSQARFVTQSSEVSDELERTLDRMFDPLFLYSGVNAVVSVASNEMGGVAEDSALSQERAQAIVLYMVDKGLEEGRFSVQVSAGGGLPVGTHRVRVFIQEEGQ